MWRQQWRAHHLEKQSLTDPEVQPLIAFEGQRELPFFNKLIDTGFELTATLGRRKRNLDKRTPAMLYV